MQLLEHAIEIIGTAGIEPVDVALGVFRRHVRLYMGLRPAIVRIRVAIRIPGSPERIVEVRPNDFSAWHDDDTAATRLSINHPRAWAPPRPPPPRHPRPSR